MRRLAFLASIALVIYACGSDDETKAGPSAAGPDGGTLDGAASGDDDDVVPGDDDDDAPGGSPVPYDQTVMKSSHNSYERDETILDQLLYHRIRSIEFDLHNGKGDKAPAGNWRIYHLDVPTLDRTSCTMLSDCLGAVAAFHAAVPQHEVVTVWLDLKDDFEPTRQPSDLDALIEKTLGRENVIAPKDLIDKCDGATTVRAAVNKPCGFPSLASLRGKIMLTVTGGSKCDGNTKVSKYGGAKPSERLAFLAPDLNASCPPAEYEKHPDVVVFNMSFDDRGLAQTMREKGLVGRIYKGGAGGGLDSEDDFKAGRAAGAVHLATDKANFEQDAWSKTHGAKGFPFDCQGCGTLEEGGPVLGLTATSGDQSGTADSAYYALTESPADESWTATIGVPSSHTNGDARACLVARASDAAGAPSVAFCRGLDGGPPRVLVRNAANGATTDNGAPPLAGFSDETVHFMRLDLKNDGAQTDIDAQVSKDGKTWVSAQKSVVNSPLPLRGVSLSSKGPKRRALFASLTKKVFDLPPEKITAAKLETKKAIGTGASGSAFDGIFEP